jgi:hypothetical protein
MNGKVKRIPDSCIDNFDFDVFIYWIFGDGCAQNSGLEIATHSFSLDNCKRLSSKIIFLFESKANSVESEKDLNC